MDFIKRNTRMFRKIINRRKMFNTMRNGAKTSGTSFDLPVNETGFIADSISDVTEEVYDSYTSDDSDSSDSSDSGD